MKHLKSSVLKAVVLFSILIVVASCSKSEDPANTIDTSFLTGRTWELQSVNMAGMEMSGQAMITSEGAEYQMTIHSDSTITYMDNMGMNPMSGKWKFQNNMTQFMVYGVEAGKSDMNTIDKLTSTELWFWHMDGMDKMTMRYKAK
jgi:hypothetical protein